MPGIMEAGSSDGDFHGFPWNWRICGPRLDFLWISSILSDLCGFHGFLGDPVSLALFLIDFIDFK